MELSAEVLPITLLIVFPSFSWSIGVLEQLGFVKIEFSLLFQVS